MGQRRLASTHKRPALDPDRQSQPAGRPVCLANCWATSHAQAPCLRDRENNATQHAHTHTHTLAHIQEPLIRNGGTGTGANTHFSSATIAEWPSKAFRDLLETRSGGQQLHEGTEVPLPVGPKIIHPALEWKPSGNVSGLLSSWAHMRRVSHHNQDTQQKYNNQLESKQSHLHRWSTSTQRHHSGRLKILFPEHLLSPTHSISPAPRTTPKTLPVKKSRPPMASHRQGLELD